MSAKKLTTTKGTQNTGASKKYGEHLNTFCNCLEEFGAVKCEFPRTQSKSLTTPIRTNEGLEKKKMNLLESLASGQRTRKPRDPARSTK